MRAIYIIVVAVLLAGCPGDKVDGKGKASEIPAVRLAPLVVGEMERAVVASAAVESERVIDVVSEAMGTIGHLQVEEGDQVKAGQQLCSILNPRTQMALERARLELGEIERELANTARLNERGFVARRSRDELDFRRRRAQLEVKRALEEVRVLRVVAPFAGVVAKRMISQGEVVNPQRPLFTLVDDQHLIAVLHIPETQIEGMQQGLSVVATSVATQVQVPGQVLRLAPVVDARSGTMRVTLSLPANQGLKPGMLIKARIVVEKKDNTLLVPRRAVDLDAPQPVVYRVISQVVDGGEVGVAKRIVPKLGLKDTTRVEVLAGLAEGDRVVVAGQSALRDGMQVRVVQQDLRSAGDAGMAGEDAPAAATTTAKKSPQEQTAIN